MPGNALDVAFAAEFRAEQRSAAASLLAHETGVLVATTAFGKTVLAAWVTAQRRVSTLVLVHRRQLQEQWVERLATFLEIERRRIGRIGGGVDKPTGQLDVALIQSLVRKGVDDDRVPGYGHVVVEPPPAGAELRAGAASGACPIRPRFVGHRRTQGRASSDHHDAVRPDPSSGERTHAGGDAPVRASRASAYDDVHANKRGRT
jgi:hypothetical protein